jgi:hypothetical protein
MDALRDECLRLRELNASLMELRQTADSARTSVEGIRSRGVRRAVDR